MSDNTNTESGVKIMTRQKCKYPMSEFYIFEDEVPDGYRISTPDDCIGCER